MDFSQFFANYGLIILMVALIGFMFWSSRRRMQRQKAEQEEKSRQMRPGAQVLLQGGLYGTLVSYDPDNLDEPAVVEIAPGIDIKVHSQGLLRVVTPNPSIDDDGELADDTEEDDQAEVSTETADPETDSDSKA